MIRNFLSLCLCVFFLLLSATVVYGQTTKLDEKIADLHLSGAVFELHNDLFSRAPGPKSPQNDLQRKAQHLLLSQTTLHTILSSRADALTLEIPYNGQILTVELFQAAVVTNEFTVKTGDWKTTPYTAGAYYRGIIKGVPHSLVAISFFDDEVIGVLAHPEWGNLNLGRLDRPDNQTAYTLYAENLLPTQPFADCVVREGHQTEKQQNQPENNLVAGCVRIFIEADYALFQNKGTVAATVNYVTGFFNAVTAIYGSETVSIALSQVYVWTTADSYSTSSSSTALDDFQAFRTNFDGDLAHLTALGGSGLGGVAYLNVLCSNSSNYGYSNINSSFQSYPTYSWTVNVVAHELGHNFSSNHTHWCGWSGGAIDNCGPTAGYDFETPPTCTTAPTPPSGGGTIMSYCHLVGSVGINLANGFGPLPGNAIRTATTSALSFGCIASTCPTYSCSAPTNLSVTSSSINSALLNWNASGGATSYTLQYRLTQSSGWTTIASITPPYNLTGLAAATIYEAQVQAVCGAVPSAFATGILFKTASSACPEPITLTSTIVSSTSVSLNWTEIGSATTWNVEYGSSGFTLGSGTAVTVSSKPYVLGGLTTGTVYAFYVRAACGGAQGNSTWVGPRTFSTPFQNDLSSGAVNLIVNAACPGTNIYSNEGATLSSGEFSPSTANGGYWITAANNTVWFKFTAPTSGTVKITTDISPLGTLDDTQIALYTTGSPTSIAAHLVSNEDGGTLGNGYATLGYYSGLTAGQVYFIQVDGWQNDVGTFCIEVHETFSVPDPGGCTSYAQSSVNGSTAPTKWYNIYTKPDGGNVGLPVAAVKSSVNLGTVTVQEIVNASVPISNGNVYYMQRYYNFECTQNAAAAKQIRLFYKNTELDALKAITGQSSATAESLNISHYDGTNEDCTPNNNGANTYTVITSVAATDIGSSGYFYLDFQSPSFSEMGAILGNASLPVELVSFTGILDRKSNVLHWITAAEKDVDEFIVERSADGIKGWEPICQQSPQSGIATQRAYQCTDLKPYARGYYRLRIRNLDGTKQYSNIVALERAAPEGILSIAPNPAQHTIYVAYNALQEQTIHFQIIGYDGRLVLEQDIDLLAGTNLLPFDVEALPAGLYYCVANGGKGLVFVKQ